LRRRIRWRRGRRRRRRRRKHRKRMMWRRKKREEEEEDRGGYRRRRENQRGVKLHRPTAVQVVTLKQIRRRRARALSSPNQFGIRDDLHGAIRPAAGTGSLGIQRPDIHLLAPVRRVIENEHFPGIGA